jgi:hypothetical protein
MLIVPIYLLRIMDFEDTYLAPLLTTCQ